MEKKSRRIRTPSGTRVKIDEVGISGKDPFQGAAYLKQQSAYYGQWNPDAISIRVMLKMLHHPVIALGEHIIWAPLVHADWDIECPDENKRRFVKGVIEPIYLKLMLFSLPAVTLGFAAFTKQWGQFVPYGEEGEPLWPARDAEGNLKWPGEEVLPVVPVDLKQLDPLTVSPIIEDDVFKGIWQRGWGDIEPLYAMWVTHHRHKVWGNLWGWPLLSNVYPHWWASGFRQALLNRHIEDRVSPPLVVEYPPGYVEDPDSNERIYNRQAALETGKAVRAGETVTMPSVWYVDDTGKPYGRQWDAKFLTGGENIEAFVELEDASDVRVLQGMLIPPQALLQAKGGIGSQSIAETLGELFWTSQQIRKEELDQQITDYLIEPIERLNWPEGPRCRLVTRRFKREDQALIAELFRVISNRPDIDVTELLDLGSMLRKSGIPEGSMKNVMKEVPGVKA